MLEVSGGREVVTFRGTAGSVSAAEFSADGSLVVTESADDTAARFWATPVVEEASVGGRRGELTELGFGPDGAFALTRRGDERPDLWRAARDAPLRWHKAQVLDVPGSGFVPRGGLSSDGELVASIQNSRIVVSRVATGARVLRAPTSLWVVAFSPDSRFLLADATIWDLASGAKVTTLKAEDVEAGAVGVGGKVAIVAESNGVSAWSVASGRRIKSLESPGGPTDTLDFSNLTLSRDGELAVVLWLNGTSDVWSTRTWRHVAALRRHDGQVIDADVSPNREYVVTAGGDDGTARIWESRTGRPIMTLDPPVDSVYDVAFAPDGDTVLVGGDDGIIRSYQCEVCRPLDALIELADSRATRELTTAERREFLHLSSPAP